jgi:hypothetical protein
VPRAALWVGTRVAARCIVAVSHRWIRAILRRSNKSVPMRISLCNEVIRELPFERQCEFAKRVGYDGLEIAPFTLGEEPHLFSALQRARVRRTAAEAGIAGSRRLGTDRECSTDVHPTGAREAT